MAGLDGNRGAKRAREARAALGLAPAQPLTCLLTVVEERAEIPVLVRAMPEEVAGCFWHDGEHRLIHLNGTHPLTRQRFTLAHELGHAWCRHDGALAVDDVSTVNGRTTTPQEIQANAFAAEFLLPRAAVCEVLERDPSLDELVLVAGAFGVSAHVVLFRCEAAGLVGEARRARLLEEIEARHHLDRSQALGAHVVEDRLAEIARALPYLSPALDGSALAGVLRGETSVARAAGSAAVDTGALGPAVAGLR